MQTAHRVASLACVFFLVGCQKTEFSVGNGRTSRRVSVEDGRLRTQSISFADEGSGEKHAIEFADDSEEFRIVTREGARVGSQFRVVKTTPTPSEEDDDSLRSLVVELADDKGWRVFAHFAAEEGGVATVRKWLRVVPPSSEDFRFLSVSVDELTLSGEAVESPVVRRKITDERQVDANGYRGGLGLGQPLYLDDRAFAILAHPTGASVLEQEAQEGGGVARRIRLQHFPGMKSAGLSEEGLVTREAVWGLSTQRGEVVETFREWIRSSWVPSPRMRHFIDAFHLRGRANIGVGFNRSPTPEELEEMYVNKPELRDRVRTEANAVRFAAATSAFARAFGFELDAFVVDGGWQNARSVFEIDSYFLPNGFAPIREAAGIPLGLWNSPAGLRLDLPYLARERGYTLCPPAKVALDLSGPEYLSALKDALRTRALVDGVNYWKQDFNFLVCPVATAKHPEGDPQSLEANADALIEILEMERELNPNVWISQTTFMWPSPLWSRWVNAVVGIDADFGYSRGIPAYFPRDWSTTFVDKSLHRMFQLNGSQYPTSRLMNHGVIQDQYVHLGGQGESLLSFANGLVAHFAPGLSLQELYIDPEMMPAAHGHFLSKTLAWTDANRSVLSRWGEMFGGDPGAGEPYGFLHHDSNRALFIVRNPSPTPQELLLPVPKALLGRGLPFHQMYPVVQRLEGARVQLGSYEVQVVELAADSAAALVLPQDGDGVYGTTLDDEGRGILMRRVGDGQWPTVDSSVLAEDAKSLKVVLRELPEGASVVAHLLFDVGEGSQIALRRNGVEQEGSAVRDTGPCGPLGCPLAHIPRFERFRVNLEIGMNHLEWTTDSRTKPQVIWLEQTSKALVEPVGGWTGAFSLPSPDFGRDVRWELVYSRYAARAVKPMKVSERWETTIELQRAEIQMGSDQLQVNIDVPEKARGQVLIPMVIDPLAGTVELLGTRATLNGEPTGGKLVLHDVQAAGELKIQLDDSRGQFHADTSAMSLPMEVRLESSSFGLSVSLDFAATTGVVTLAHGEQEVVAQGQVLAEDGSLRLAAARVVPKDVPLIGDLPAAIILEGQIFP